MVKVWNGGLMAMGGMGGVFFLVLLIFSGLGVVGFCIFWFGYSGG